MNGGGVSTQIGLRSNGPRESVDVLIGQFAGSEVDYPLYGPAFPLAAEGTEPDVFIV